MKTGSRLGLLLLKAIAEAANQAGNVGSESAVVGVHLVEHDVSDAVVLEDLAAVLPHQHVLEHQVVRQQQVRRAGVELGSRRTRSLGGASAGRLPMIRVSPV